jgi:hypothetical protein
MKQPGSEKILKEKKIDEKLWKEWERKGGWTPEGWKIIEMNDGPTLNTLKPEKFLIVHRPHGSLFHHSYGKVSKFFMGLLWNKMPEMWSGLLPAKSTLLHSQMQTCRN